MSKKLILHIGAGKVSMETQGFQGTECLETHTKYRNIFGHAQAVIESQEDTPEMHAGQEGATSNLDVTC